MRPKKRSEVLLNTVSYLKEGTLGVVTLNRPRSLNALNAELMKELGALLDEIGSDKQILTLIITGGPKSFCVGADISEIGLIQTPAQAHGFAEIAQKLFLQVETLPQPVIAAISGPAVGGGCEIALACDLRIAAENAVFGLPEIKIGVMPGGGGTQRLPRLVGMGRAKEMIYLGDSIDAAEAYRIGLVNRVVPPEKLMEESRAMASKLATRPPLALKMCKRVVNDGMTMDARSALAYESRCFEILFSTEDQKEGMGAFSEKRKPVFRGK
jgi:enoyl-CoA hydratase